MNFFDDHKLYDKLEYCVYNKKECFTLYSSSIDYQTKKEQDFATLLLSILNLADDQLNKLDKHIGILNHVTETNSVFNDEREAVNKAKLFISKIEKNSSKNNYDVLKIMCQLKFFNTQIVPIEYYDINYSNLKNNYSIEDISTVVEYCKKEKIKKVSKYEIKKFEDFIVASMGEVFKSGRTIKKCENCGKYYLPLRNDAKYCENPSPQNPLKTCKKIMPELNFNLSLEMDPDKKLHRTIDKNLNKNINRKDSSEYAKKQYEKKAKEFKNIKNKLKSGEITEETVLAWIKENGLKKDSN